MECASLSSTVSWLHLSDFHTGKDGYEESEMFSRIIQHVRKKVAAGFVPDFVFITGDIADKGAPDQYEKFCDGFLQPLQEAIGGGIHCRTYMVPGNHDLDRKVNHAFDRVEFGKLRERYFDPTPDGASSRKMLAQRFSSFIAHDVTDRADRFADSQGAFAERVTLRGTHVGIVGVNTAWLSRDEHDEGFLTLGKPLLEKALRDVDESELTIVLGHHPISWFAKERQRPIRSLLAHQSAFICTVISTMRGASPAMVMEIFFWQFSLVLPFKLERGIGGAMVWFGGERILGRVWSVCSPITGMPIIKIGR